MDLIRLGLLGSSASMLKRLREFAIAVALHSAMGQYDLKWHWDITVICIAVRPYEANELGRLLVHQSGV